MSYMICCLLPHDSGTMTWKLGQGKLAPAAHTLRSSLRLPRPEPKLQTHRGAVQFRTRSPFSFALLSRETRGNPPIGFPTWRQPQDDNPRKPTHLVAYLETTPGQQQTWVSNRASGTNKTTQTQLRSPHSTQPSAEKTSQHEKH